MASDRGVTEEAVGTRIYSNMETRYIDTVNDVEAHVSEDGHFQGTALGVDHEHRDMSRSGRGTPSRCPPAGFLATHAWATKLRPSFHGVAR
jgi:hypothetical protein